MEGIRGKQAYQIDTATVAARVVGYHEVAIDIGTGDGRYVRHVARQSPTCFAIGIDACRENLRAISRDALPNMLFIIANALALPRELCGMATRITINFPWGSLLAALRCGDANVCNGLATLARPGATLEIRLNQGACAQAGDAFGADMLPLREALRAAGFTVARWEALPVDALRTYPTTWAKRLAYGRDPSARLLVAMWRG